MDEPNFPPLSQGIKEAKVSKVSSIPETVACAAPVGLSANVSPQHPRCVKFTFDIASFDQADLRPGGRNLASDSQFIHRRREILGQASCSQRWFTQGPMDPSQTDLCLDDLFRGPVIMLDSCQQRRDQLGEVRCRCRLGGCLLLKVGYDSRFGCRGLNNTFICKDNPLASSWNTAR